MAAIVVDGVGKRFRGAGGPALDDVSLEVAEGSVCGLLGPNGAGKTTLVRILCTLLRADGGRAVVAGADVAREPRRVRQRIGLVGQQSTVDDELSARQNLELFAGLHHLPARRGRALAGEALERFGLADTGTLAVARFSGGMRRRLDIAASTLVAPAVLFLDEPTTGLDPQGRAQVWEAVRTLRTEGTSVLLTTQYLDEADRLADHIVVLRAGAVVGDGTPAALKSRLGGDRVEVTLAGARSDAAPTDVDHAVRVLREVVGAEPVADAATGTVSVGVSDRLAALAALVPALQTGGVPVADIALREPTLDEVFLSMTGGAR